MMVHLCLETVGSVGVITVMDSYLCRIPVLGVIVLRPKLSSVSVTVLLLRRETMTKAPLIRERI